MALLLPVTHDLTDRVIGAATCVHRQLGPGLLESAYRQCLVWELTARGVACRMEVPLGMTYRGRQVSNAFRLDLLVGEALIVDLKSVERLHPIHQSRMLTYLKLTGLHAGLIINFNVPVLRQGIQRIQL
ncbi:MAG: GxxExxY protein [Gemmatimonadales bacterium]